MDGNEYFAPEDLALDELSPGNVPEDNPLDIDFSRVQDLQGYDRGMPPNLKVQWNPRSQPSEAEAFAAGFTRESTPYAAYQLYQQPEFEDDPEYNAVEDKANEGYLNYEGVYEWGSAAEAAYRRSQIDKERDRDEVIAKSPYLSAVGMLSGAVISPESLIPFAGPAQKIYKSAQVVEGAAIGGLTLTSLEAGREMLLQMDQQTRSMQESVTNTLFAGAIGSVLGGSLGLLKSTKEVETIAKKMQDDVHYGGSVGAYANKMTAEEARLVGSGQLADAAKLTRASPAAYLAKSSSPEAQSMARQLAEDFFVRQGNLDGVATEMSAETYAKLAEGELADVFVTNRNLYKEYRKAGGKLGRKDFDREVTASMRAGDVHENPIIQQASRKARELIDRRTKEAVEQGRLDPRYLDKDLYGNYVHRIWNRAKIIADRPKLQRILKNHIGKDEGLQGAELDQVVDDTINTLLRGDADEAFTSVKTGDFAETSASATKQRTLNIPDEKIAEFLEDDYEYIMAKFNREMAADTALHRVFGNTSLRDSWTKVEDEYTSLINDAHKAGDTKKAIKLEHERENVREYLLAMRDRLRGTYGKPDNPNSVLYRTGRALSNLNYLRLLGGMTLSAIPDLGTLIVRNGMGNTLNMMGKMMGNPELRKIARAEMRAMSVGLDVALGGRAKAFGDLADPYMNGTKLERGLEAASSSFSKFALMDIWNTSLKTVAGVTSQSNMIKAINAVVDGKATQKQIRDLARVGIDENKARLMAQEIANHGESINKVPLSNASRWTDQDLATDFKAAILKTVDSTIITPGVGDTPLFMSKPMGRLMGQFKTFSFTVLNRTTIPAMQQRDAETAAGLAMMVFLGYAAYASKQLTAGKEVETEDVSKMAWEAFDRSGVGGIFMEGAQIGLKTTGLGSALGIGGTRYASRNVMGAIAGPSFGLGQDTAGLIHDAFSGDWGSDQHQRALRIVPYANLFYWRRALEQTFED